MRSRPAPPPPPPGRPVWPAAAQPPQARARQRPPECRPPSSAHPQGPAATPTPRTLARSTACRQRTKERNTACWQRTKGRETQRVGRERKEKKHSAIRTVETQRKARRNQQLSRSLCAIWGLENGCSTRAEDRAPALFWRTHPPPRRTTPRRGRPRRQQRAPAGQASPSRRPSIGCHQSLLPRWTMRWTLSRVENMIQQAKLKERPKQCRGRSKRDAVGNAYSTRAKAICIQCVELKES